MSAQRQSRIPTSLQAVFLTSNRGMEVSQPPPERVAYKVFFRNWRFQSKTLSDSGKQGGGSVGGGIINSFRKNRGSLSSNSCKAPKSQNKQDLFDPPKREASKPATESPKVKYQPLLKPKEPVPPTPPTLSPQAYLDAMIRSRGYSTSRFKSLQTAYYSKPTPLQQASYDIHINDLVRNREIDEFRAIIVSGISPNPCNSFGESTLHMVCRKGETEFLRAMLDAGASVQVADDYGRTPLHDACWAARPCFDVVKLILQRDSRLFHLTDCRGAVPLSYVPKKDWTAWLQFLESIKDEHWPQRDMRAGEQEPPELALLGANTRPLPSPANAFTPELAAMVASGKMTPDEAHFLAHDKTECSTNEGDSDWEEDEGDSDGSSEDSDDSDYDSDDDSDDDFSLNEEEMADILNSLTLPTN